VLSEHESRDDAREAWSTWMIMNQGRGRKVAPYHFMFDTGAEVYIRKVEDE
jgi:hypothetical protein